MSKTAVILAGGHGKRLGQYTTATPKALLPIHGRPMIEILITKLQKTGFTRFILAVNHLADHIRCFCKDGLQWNVSIEYSEDSEPLGTIGPIKQIPNLPDHFLIMNSDILTDLNYGTFFDCHIQDQNLFTIASFDYVEQLEYGILEIEDRHLIGFKEKPTFAQTVNMGIYMATKKILDFIPEQTPFGIDHLITKLFSLNQPIATLLHRGKWIDIGSIKNYEKAPHLFTSEGI